MPAALGTPALTVLVATDGREKTRLLAALAEGDAPDTVHAARRPAVGATDASAEPAGRVNGHRGVHAAAAPDAVRLTADTLLAARLRLAAARAEEAQLRAAADGALPPDPKRALQLVGEAAEYRARLLQLAATRARLAALEQAIASCEHRLAAFASLPETAAEELAAPADELSAWQERVACARAAETAAARAVAEAGAAARRLGAQVARELARDAGDEAPDVDTRWRRLWHLRRDLEEIWEVQSRAEAEARALLEREAALRAAESTGRWRPARRLLRFSGGAALAGSLIALYSPLWLDGPPDTREGVLAAALVLVHAWLLFWSRLAGRSAERRRDARERQRAAVADLRRRRDRDWSRAAQLATAIEAGAEALGLPQAVTPDLIEAREHAMADELRREGGETPLTALLLELLAAEEASERADARHAAAADERAVVEREWVVWRDASGLPPQLDAAQIGEWLDTRGRLAAARAEQIAERTRLERLEPATAAWEDEVRALLAAAGQPVTSEVCGRGLTAELAALGRRVRAARQRERRCAHLATELRAAEAALAAAEAAARIDARPPPPSPATDGASMRTSRLLEIAGAILAHATNGAYTGLRTAPNGGVLVLDARQHAVPITAIPDRAGRRCVQFLLRLGEALIAPPRLLVVDDALAGLDDAEAATVARAIAALASTRPLVYVTSGATRARALRLLPPTARVLE